ncbi:hypothetical protein DPMN_186073 [Dreissena polymorpha]|uniref:Uncharacterized protein n=1 Tax=Dreissena polymorpha TaxID=45954 RepID=A0A9D4I9A0_DREPO|nr:hypothetical protein DPMN_186073 [Dreissena polymorpha]
MLFERSPDLESPELRPKKLADVFCEETDTQTAEYKRRTKRVSNMKGYKHQSTQEDTED